MEGRGVRAVIENVYVYVEHMFSRKVFVRAIRGHMLCASAVPSLLFEEFWDEISPEKKIN